MGVPRASRWAQSLARNSHGSEVPKRLGLEVLHLNQRAGGFWCSHVHHEVCHWLVGPVRALADGERAGIWQSWFGASLRAGRPAGTWHQVKLGERAESFHEHRAGIGMHRMDLKNRAGDGQDAERRLHPRGWSCQKKAPFLQAGCWGLSPTLLGRGNVKTAIGCGEGWALAPGQVLIHLCFLKPRPGRLSPLTRWDGSIGAGIPRVLERTRDPGHGA